MRFRNLNSFMLTCIGILICCMVTLSIWVISSDTYNTVLTSQQETMKRQVSSVEDAVEDYIDDVKTIAQLIATEPSSLTALRGNAQAASVHINHFLQNNPDYWAAFVFDANGKIVAGSNANGTNLAGEDRNTRDYVHSVLSEKQVVISQDILMSQSGSAYIFAVAAPVRDEYGNVIGGVGIFPFWHKFTERYLDNSRIGEEGYGYMLDAKGRVIAHAIDKKLMLKDMRGYDFINTILTEGSGATQYEWEGRAKRMSFKTIPATGWIVIMSAYEDDLAALAIKQRNYLAIGGVAVAILLIALVALMLRRAVIIPVNRMLTFAGRITDGDFKAELEGEYKYELALLADKLGVMVADLKHKLGFSQGVLNGLNVPCGIVGPDFRMVWVNKHLCTLLEKPEALEKYAGIKSGEMYWNDPGKDTLSNRAIRENSALQQEAVWVGPSGTTKHIKVDTTPFHDMDGTMLGSVSIWTDLTEIRIQQEKIRQQNERIAHAAIQANQISHQLSSAAERLAAQINEANTGSGVQLERAGSTATAMEEMNATIFEVARNAGSAAKDASTAKDNAQNGADIVSKVIEAISAIHTKAEGLRISMEKLGTQAESIGDVMNVISDIADQTNLLALNAAIEAARAGDAGRGFAVVADEVRKLAEKTMRATLEVGEAISVMQNVAASNVHATGEAAQAVSSSTELAQTSGETLREIVTLIETVADQVSSIATAADQQSAASDEINRSMDEINRISEATAGLMTQSLEAVQGVSKMASELNRVIAEMSSE